MIMIFMKNPRKGGSPPIERMDNLKVNISLLLLKFEKNKLEIENELWLCRIMTMGDIDRAYRIK